MSKEQISEAPQPLPGPEVLLALQGEIFNQWQKLPVAHQAALLILCVEHIRQAENGEWWLEGVFRQLAHSPEQKLAVPFEVTSVSRVDVAHALDLTEAVSLSDADMRRLAQNMEDAYVDRDFWDDLTYFAARIVKDRQHTSISIKGKEEHGMD
jgi:UTP:GlnB (protein PII) uridylyltransferase